MAMANGPDWERTPLSLLPAYRITEIPRRVDGAAHESGQRDQSDDPGRPQRVAALMAAYHAGIATGIPASPVTEAAAGGAGRASGIAAASVAADGTVAFGWVRIAAGGPVHVVAGGEALTGSPVLAGGPGRGSHEPAAGQVLLSLPGGARGTILPPGGLPGLLETIPSWREIAGISDGLLAPADESRHGNRGARHATPSLDEGLLGSWTGPFGWIVVAEPLRPAELSSLAGEVARRQRVAEGVADRYADRAAETRRLKERHAELEKGISTGFWRIRVLAGGCDPASAARVAGLLCASAALDGLPYALSPAAAEQAGAPGGDAVPASPFCGSTELLAALARPPECEVPGVRLALRPDFDVTPEWTTTMIAGTSPRYAPKTTHDLGRDGQEGQGGGSIELGEVLDRNMMPAGPFALARESLNRHVFVCGATGSGKSQTVRSLLEAATGQNIPWLVIEPAKAEYRLMASRLPGTEVITIRPGEPDAVAAGLNPLEPAVDASGNRFPLQTHADLVRALFIAAFRSEEPFPQVLSAALTRVYEEAGWDLALGEPAGAETAYPTLTALQRAAERVVTEIGYSQRITDDVLGFIRVRLASLRLGTTGRFLEGGHPIDFGALLRKNVVLEIEDVGDDADKAFLMGAVLIRLAEHLRLTHRTTHRPVTGLSHLTVVEEAHRLLRRTEPATAGSGGGGGAGGHAVEMFAGLLAEIRAYGEGLVIADQIPARLVPDVIKNTAVKITHRLPAADDRDAVGATMNATPRQSRFLVTLAPGQAAVFSDGMDFPVLVKMKDGSEREVATVPATLDARTVVVPRSVTCGGECAASPCTLRQMRVAQRALDDFPWVRLWAELAVLAHLTGWPVPVPGPAALGRFRELPARVSQCATGHAVDAAVAARPAVLCSSGEPGALAAHAHAAIRARADRDQWLCAADEPEWLLPGPVTEAVAFGVARPSAIERAGPLPELLGEFIDCDWPLRYLSRPD
jgi:DNA helicase HerA-like ATPase